MLQYEKSVLEYDDVKRAVGYSHERGIEKGIERGIEKGIERGIEKGKIIIAKNLLELGIPVKDIAKATNLTSEQILLIK